jgi:uncharacterized membrane protein YbhN (UPF0104 family)
MSFWNEAFFFEKYGDRYVYRPTVLSAGFDVSETEKDRLFRGLLRLQRRFLIEGFVVLALIFGFFQIAVFNSQRSITWFMISSLIVLSALAVVLLHRRDRLIRQVLGDRTPEVPRLPFREALARPRPLVSTRLAIPILKSVVVLHGLVIGAGDAFVLYVVVVAFGSRQSAEAPEELSAALKALSDVLNGVGFWVVVGLFNVILLVSITFFVRQMRRLRDNPDIS